MNALREANQYRSIRAKCLPLFGLAEGWSPDVQESIYKTMVLHIAASLGVEASARDLEAPPAPRILLGAGVDWNTVADAFTGPLVTYDPDMWGFTVSPSCASRSERGLVPTEREWLGWTA